MGCGAVPKDSVAEYDDNRPYTKSNVNVNNNRKGVNNNGKPPQKQANGYNSYNNQLNGNNRSNNSNNVGFKKVDIKYSDEYYQDKNKPVVTSNNKSTNSNSNNNNNNKTSIGQ